MLRDDPDLALYVSGKKQLGSWSKALIVAGVDPKSVDLRGAYKR